jgi:hypothetical protein
MVRASGAGRRPARVTWAVVCRLALALKGVEESTSYGTPALKVGGKLIARLREDGETVAVRTGFLERQERMAADPEAFFLTDHYLNYPAVVVRLAKVERAELKELLTETWRCLTSK